MKNRKQNRRPASNRPGRNRAAANHPTTLRFRRILVPLDFSGQSRQALQVAVPLAEQYGGRIALMHVVEPVRPVGEMGIAYLPLATRTMVQHAKSRLRETLNHFKNPALLDPPIVRVGSAGREIAAAARGLKSDLIILATQGRTGLSRALLGSTAERVVREAQCPVLTVRKH